MIYNKTETSPTGVLKEKQKAITSNTQNLWLYQVFELIQSAL
jgi:hypothetical protein